MFATIRFLQDQFVDVDGVVGLIGKYWADVPKREAVRKWFSRAQIPAEWFPVLVYVLQREPRGVPDFADYMTSGGENDVFA